MFIALFLVVFGVIYLLKNLGLIEGSIWNILWPSLIIIFGLSVIFKQRHKKHWWDFFDNKTSQDWEHWGREFGQRMEHWGSRLEQKYKEPPEEWENEFGRKIEQRIKKFFESNRSSDTKE